MNYKTRLKNIDKHLSENKGIEFKEILKPEYKYTGKPFNNFDEMYIGLNLCDLPPYHLDNEVMILLEKNILAYDSIPANYIKQKALKEMELRL
jgi:hypothetical protein